jgi:hypothetical protein
MFKGGNVAVSYHDSAAKLTPPSKNSALSLPPPSQMNQNRLKTQTELRLIATVCMISILINVLFIM